MKVLHISSECAPWAKSGGLGDVVGALPDALTQADPDVRCAVILPLYRKAKRALGERGLDPVDTGVVADVNLGAVTARVRFLALEREGRATVFFAQNEAAFDREGLYGFDDDALRFILLCKAAVAMAPVLMDGAPDVVHCHDWHAALATALIATSARHMYPRTRTVQSIHNLAYQGVFSKELVPISGLGWDQFHMNGAEFHDHLSLLKAGIALADVVSTVSPSYAREIQTPEFGANLDGFLRRFRIFGILNGIDTDVWNPEADAHVAGSWSADDLGGKDEARAALLEECDWPDLPGVPTLGVVSRMTGQKGLDLVAALVPELYRLGGRLVVLGSGDPALEHAFRSAAAHHPKVVRAAIEFDVEMSHRIIAGCDALLLPSRFEPCGLTQLYAMRYGTVPVVHAVGGLRDTVRDPGTGFAFEHPTAQGLRWALERACRTYREAPDTWRAIQQTGMRTDWSWARSARTYLALYRG